MNQPLYNDLLNAAFVLTTQEENKKSIQALQKEITRRDQNLKRIAGNRTPNGHAAKKVWGIILLVLGGTSFFLFALMFTQSGSLSDVLASSDAGSVLLLPVIAVPCIIGGICLFASARRALDEYTYRNNQLIAQTRQENDEKNRAANAEIARLNTENSQLKASEPEVLAFLPETYCTTQATCYMLLAVKDGRADTLKEAMNLYEEQLHRWKMEKLAADSARMQQIQLEAMQELAANQEQIQTQLSVITALQIADMLLD